MELENQKWVVMKGAEHKYNVVAQFGRAICDTNVDPHYTATEDEIKEHRKQNKAYAKSISKHPQIIKALKDAIVDLVEYRDELVRQIGKANGEEKQELIDRSTKVTKGIESSKELLTEASRP